MSFHPVPTRVLVCGANPILAEALCDRLERCGPFATRACAGDPGPALAAFRPDVVLLDPARSGGPLEAWPALVARHAPRCDLLAYVDPGDRRTAGACLAAGFAGAVSQGRDVATLVGALTAVRIGGVYVDDDLAPLGRAAEAPEAPAPTGACAALSERERAVLEHVARGFSNKETANRLGLSAKTVETYRARGAGKLGLRRKSDIVRFALSNDWLAAGQELA